MTDLATDTVFLLVQRALIRLRQMSAILARHTALLLAYRVVVLMQRRRLPFRDFAAFYCVVNIKGQEAAEFTQLVLEYDPQPTMNSGHPRSARPEIVEQIRGLWGRTDEAVRVAKAHMDRRAQSSTRASV